MLFVAPTRYAAGIPHKIHLASSFGVPTITTSLIAQQMKWESNEALLIADNPEHFASVIESAYGNSSLLLDCRNNMLEAFKAECNEHLFDRNIKAMLVPR